MITVGVFTNAQQTVLISNNWILERLLINNQEYLFPNLPVVGNNPKPEGKVLFSNDQFSARICNSMGGDIVYSENSFTTTASGLTLGGCPAGYDDYENLYFGNFFGGDLGTGIYYSKYIYSIDTTNGSKVLVLINPKGDKAFYRSSGSMAVAELHSKTLSIHPNPVKNSFLINTKDKIEQVEIYSASGQLLKAVKSQEISISDFPKGNYLIKIKTDKGISTQKIIKE